MKKLTLLGLSLTALLFFVSSAFGQAQPVQLINVSTRSRIDSGSGVLTIGISVIGDPWVPVTVLVRAVGPTLAQFGIADHASAPSITLYDRNGTVVRSNSGWNDDQSVIVAESKSVAFPLATGSKDSAFVTGLTPGTYTVQIRDPGSVGKQVLGEIYLVGRNTGISGLANMSVRSGYPSTTGFVLDGKGTCKVLLRAVGPSLARFGVASAMTNPKLTAYDVRSTPALIIGFNDDWGLSSTDLATYFAEAGAFPLDYDSRDAAIVLTIQVDGQTMITSIAEPSGIGPFPARQVTLNELYKLQ